MTTAILRCLSPFMLPLALAAQTGGEPILVVETASPEVARLAGTAFELDGELPVLDDGEHFVVRVDAAGQCRVVAATGEVGYLTVRGRPAALAKVFADELELAKPVVQAAMMVGLQQQGFQAKEVGAFLKELWLFPEQLQQFTLRLDGDPRRLADGLTATLDVDPLPGGYVGRLVDALEPGPGGAPRLPSAGAVIALRCSLAPKSMATVLGPFEELGLRMTHRGEEELQKARAFNARWKALYDGSFAMTFGEGMRGTMLVGVNDVAALQTLLRGDEYRHMLEGQQLSGMDVEYTVTPDAFEHRGCRWMRTTAEGMPPSPFVPDGRFSSHVGAVGSYMAVVLGGDETHAKATIDAVLGGAVKRTELGDGAVLEGDFDVEAMFAMMQQLTGNPPGFGQGMPRRVSGNVSRRGHSLRCVVRVK